MPKKNGKPRVKRPAPFPPVDLKRSSHVPDLPHDLPRPQPKPPIIETGFTGMDKLTQHKNSFFPFPQKTEPFLINGKALIPPREMAFTPEQSTMKRFCPSTTRSDPYTTAPSSQTYYTTPGACYAAGIGITGNNGAFTNPYNNSISGSDSSPFRVVLPTISTSNITKTVNASTGNADTESEGWISYLWSFLPFS